MKGRNLILTGLIALVVGLLLILFRDSLANGGVVIAGGILFVVAGVLNMTVFLASRDKQGRAHLGAFGTAFGWIASAAAVVLGLAMIIFSHVFVAIVGFMFAVLLLFGALFQIFLILFGARPVSLSRWFFLVPTALIGAALFIFLRKPDTIGEHTIMLLTGIGLGIFGLFTIIEGCAIGQENHRALRESRAAAKPAKNTLEEPVKEAVKEPVKDEAPVAEQDEKKDS